VSGSTKVAQLPVLPALPLVIQIEGGQAQLTLSAFHLASIGKVESLSMAVPNLRFPFDLSSGAGRFSNRRCQLSSVTLSVGVSDIVTLLARAPLASIGIERPIVEMGVDGFTLQARVEVGSHSAELTAAGYFRLSNPRQLRVAFYDLRLHGFLPLAAPQLVTALLRALCGNVIDPIVGSEPRVGPGKAAFLQGPTEVVLEPLELALLDLFPPRGWRMPGRGSLRVEPMGHGGDRLLLHFGSSGSAAGDEEIEDDLSFSSPGTHSSGKAAYEEGRSLFSEAESALASGDVAAALVFYRRAATLHSGNVFVATRLLQLLCITPSSLSEAEELASALLARLPGFSPALLARAVASSYRGRFAESGDLYEQLAGCGDPLPGLEAATALTAAAEAYLSAGQVERAFGLLEKVRAARPSHPRALDLLRRIFASQNRWNEWLTLLRRRELEEPSAATRAKLLCDAGQVLLDELHQADRAAERFAEAAVLDEDLADAWLGLGRARKAMRAFDGAREALEKAISLFSQQRQGTSEGNAFAELAQCEESAGMDAAAEAHWSRALALRPAFVPWLQRCARVLARLGRGEDAANLLSSAIAASEGDAKLDLNVERAGLLGRVLGDKARGRIALEDVLRLNPAHLSALDELSAQSEEKDLADVLVFFERALERIVDPVTFAAVLGRARDVADRARRPDFVVNALEKAAATGTIAGARAAITWAEEWLLQNTGPSEEGVASAAALVAVIDKYLAAPVANTGALRAELAFMRGRLAEALDDNEAAQVAYKSGLEGAGAFEVCVEMGDRFAALLSAKADWSGAANALAQAIEQAGDPRPGTNETERLADLWIAAAKHFERAGAKEKTFAAWRSATVLDPSRPEPWRAIENVFEARGEHEELAAALQSHAANTRLGERRDTYARLGELYSKTLNDNASADVAFAHALEVDGEHIVALLWAAQRAWDEGRMDEAATFSERLLRVASRPDGRGQVPDSAAADAHLRLSRWGRVMGSLPEADSHQDRALLFEPHGGTLSLLIDVLEAAGEGESLVRALGRRLEVAAPLSPEYLEIESAFARALERQGRSDEAIEVYRRRLATAPDDLETKRRLIELCRRESRFDELLATLQRLLDVAEDQPSGAESHLLDPLVLKLEIARALWRSGKDIARAEEMLRALMESPSVLKEAGESLGRLLLSLGQWQQADEILARAGLIDTENAKEEATDDSADLSFEDIDEPSLVVQRARARMEGEAGVAAAYAVLKSTDLGSLPVAGLALRAELARKVGNETDVSDVLTEAATRLDPASSDSVVATLNATDRDAFLSLADLGMPSGVGPLPLLERLAERGPIDASTAVQLAILYEALQDVEGKQHKLRLLIEPGSPTSLFLHPAVRGRLWIKLALLAAKKAETANAEECFGFALAQQVEGSIRAGWLVARADFSVGQKALESAVADLDEALSEDPNHTGALAAFAELSYRLQDWAEARGAYDALAAKEDSASVVSPVTLSFRRAELAEMFGDEEAAEASYRKVLEFDNLHVAAREALAQFAYIRQDFDEVVSLLTLALQAIPAEAAARRVQMQERLAECLLALDDAATARSYLEDAIRLEPMRLSALQRLTQAAEMLGDHATAASLWNRLSRLYTLPRERARALFREGELQRVFLQNTTAAVDAYLRSADMDPTFAPALVRLVPFYWERGEVLDVAGVAADLHANEEGRQSVIEESLGLVLCLASAAAGDPMLATKVAPAVWPTASDVFLALGELATHAPDAVSSTTRAETAWALLKTVLPEHLREELVRLAVSPPDDAPDDVKRLGAILD
jgi:Tfp pilus assembly protein PilF